MPFSFNPFTGTLDITGNSVSTWKDPVANYASLPAAGNADGDARVALDSNDVFVWDAATSTWKRSTGVSIGAFSSTGDASGLTVTDDSVLTLHAATSTTPGGMSTVAQTLAGAKTFLGSVLADGGVDVTATAGTDALNVGTGNADVVNIGRAGATVNLYGDVANVSTTNLDVTDKNITINKSGPIASAAGAGLGVEEGAAITGYVQVSADRNSWELKAPATTGIVTFTPGASSVLINQSVATTSSPTFSNITLSTHATAGVLHNSATGVVSSSLIVNADVAAAAAIALDKLAASTASVVPVFNASGFIAPSTTTVLELSYLNSVTSDIQTQLDGKQATGSYITGLNGDVSATGPGPVAATVNSVGGTTAANVASGANAANAATDANTVSTIVKRDASGNFSAGTITATINGSSSGNLGKISGDLDPASASLADSQFVAAAVLGLSFSNVVSQSAQVHYSIVISATTPLYEAGTLTLVKTSNDWLMSRTSVGDTTGIVLSVDGTGQVQYTGETYAGFISGVMKFRAITTPI